ncbi:MAG: apolipoprotein N-acyltransferase, partial [Caldilineae bacterium]
MPLRLSRPAVVSVLLSGFGLGLSFPPYPFPFLAWVALVPLLCRWDRSPTAAPLLLEAYLAFLLTFAVAFYWPLGHALPSAALASLTPLLALPLVMALPFGASVLVRNRLGRRAGLIALVACWMLVEGGLSRGPLAFPWTLLGHTQAAWLPLIQMADVTGVPGLTLWVWLMNQTVVALLHAPARRRPALVLMLLLALPLAYGHLRRTTLPAPAGYLTVAVVQPALPAVAWADVHDTSRIDTLFTLTERLLTSSSSKPDLIVWPETALPVMPAHDPPRPLREAVTRWAVPLLTGAIVRMPDATYRNSAVLLRPDGSTARYDKQRLVP